MRTADNQRFLINLASMYPQDAIEAIDNSNYAKDIDNPVFCETVKEDIKTFIDIVQTNKFYEYALMDTLARDTLMDILADAFCFIDAETYIKLSEIVIRAMQSNNRAAEIIANKDAIEALNNENKELQKLNSMLLRYAVKTNPDID